MEYSVFNTNRSEYGRCSSWAVWDDISSTDDALDIATWWNEQYGGTEMGPASTEALGLRFKLNPMVRTLQNVSNQAELNRLSLNPNIVLLAYNFAERDGASAFDEKVASTFATDFDGPCAAHCSFHEEGGHSKDFKLRSAVTTPGSQGTRLRGAYITDLVKFRGEELKPLRLTKGDKVPEAMKKQGYTKEDQVRGLIRELKSLGCEDPTIICMHSAVYGQLATRTRLEFLKENLGHGTRLARIPHYSTYGGATRYTEWVHRRLVEQDLTL